MKVDGGGLAAAELKDVPSLAAQAEMAGYDGMWMPETVHDPFLYLLLAAQTTETIEIGTSVLVAFARSPMTVAMTAWDVQRYSGGRLNLGLGSQVQQHITRRFSMPWSQPADRMRDFVLALHAIWRSWNDGEKLRYEGEFYKHTLMT
ncbi:MAG: putative oxidoreductase, partial [Ilumatobacteraceae bacterium]|nr:putative oxidoreductase [Ilumatobacteraceae bacterium]